MDSHLPSSKRIGPRPIGLWIIAASLLPAGRLPAAEKPQFVTRGCAAMVSLVPADPGELRHEIAEPPAHGRLSPVPGRPHLFVYRADDEFAGEDRLTHRPSDAPDSEPRSLVLRVLDPAPLSPGYFIPGRGTPGVSYATGAPARLAAHGLDRFPEAFAISSRFGREVSVYEADGSLRWRFQTRNSPWSVAIDEDGSIVTADYDEGGSYLLKLNPSDGDVLAAHHFKDWSIAFANPVGGGAYLLARRIRSDPADKGQVVLWSEDSGIVWEYPGALQHPRWAEMAGDLVAIADTFGHRTIVHDRRTGVDREWSDSFPNDLRWMPDGRLLVTEEHADRIYLLDPSDGSAELVLAAPGMEDLSLDAPAMAALNGPARRVDPDSEESRSRSSLEYSGLRTVYAPNGAVPLPEGGFLVADTDNNRVLFVDGAGEVLVSLSGFNNVEKVAPLSRRPGH
jgi:hypothetical protein